MEYWTENIADYVFEWGQLSSLYVYRDSQICYLREACEKGWLTGQQIGVICEKHEQLFGAAK